MVGGGGDAGFEIIGKTLNLDDQNGIEVFGAGAANCREVAGTCRVLPRLAYFAATHPLIQCLELRRGCF